MHASQRDEVLTGRLSPPRARRAGAVGDPGLRWFDRAAGHADTAQGPCVAQQGLLPVNDTSVKHRLTAIFAADAAGFSRLMAVDERATVAALDAARRVFRDQIEAHQGRVIDMAGDSVLAVSNTASTESPAMSMTRP